MKIVIIGTGNTATVLGRKLKAASHDILQVFGRNAATARKLANELDSGSTNNWDSLNRNADIYILAVTDTAIEQLLNELKLSGKTIVHTAAAVSKDILSAATDHFGVFYPLQSLKKDTGYIPDTPIIVDAGDKNTLEQLKALAESISDKVIEADDEKRLKLHLAAVFANNFVNHLYALTEQYCRTEHIDFSMLTALIKETAARMETVSPLQSQTGPAIRNDRNTIEKHRKELAGYPQLLKIYNLFTESIYNTR